MNGFHEFVPGSWSSHPKALGRQRRIFVFAALLPLALVAGLGAWAFVDCGGWQKLLHPATASFSGELIWLKLLAVLACAAGGAYVALTLMYGLSMVGDNGDGDDLPFPAWLLALTLLSWTAPILFWFFRRHFLPPGRLAVLNLFLNALCLVPVLAIVLWIKFHGAPGKGKTAKGGEGKGTRAWIPALLCTLLAAAAAWPECPYRTEWGEGWGAAALLLWCLALARMGKKGKEPPGPPRRNDDEPPEWIGKVAGRLPDGITLEGGVRRAEIPDAAGFAENPDGELLLLMDGRTPTVDQLRFFRRFRDSRDEAWRKLYEENKSEIASAGCNLLLTGVEGSGRTEILLATALYAALVRGECVLYLVASPKQARALKEKADGRLRALKVDDYVETEVLVHSSMKALLQRRAPLPGILFATPGQIEENFFADSIDVDSEAVEKLRGMMLAYGTVLVDDFCGHPQPVRAHLAFLLDKWRLVLANGFVVPQFVVVLPPVYRPEGIQELGLRLFGPLGFSLSDDIVVLRPRKTDPYWTGTIRIAAGLDVDKSVAAVLDLCLAEALQVLYYSRGMSESEKDGILRNLESPAASLRLLSSIDEMTGEDAGADAVLHLSITSGNASAAMRLHSGARQAVFLRIVSEAEVEVAPVSERLIPLPGETALALRVHHLKSVLKFIAPLTPVDAAAWSRFGISMTSGTIREGWLGDDASASARWFHDSWTERSYSARVVPYIVLENAVGISTNGYHIGSGVLPAPEEALWKTEIGPGAQRLLLARPQTPGPAVGSVVEWRDAQGNPFGESDLAHVERFECEAGDNTFVFDEFAEVEKGNGRHVGVAAGKPSGGAGMDPVFPERTLSWDPAAGSPCAPASPSKAGNVATFRLENAERAGVVVSGICTGVVNPLGRYRGCAECPYDYKAYIAGIVLAPGFSPGDREETERCLGPLAAQPVTTASDNFSPVLTHAFSAAIKQMFDDAAFFAATPAFWIEGGRRAAGKAVVWFLEPEDSGRALFPVFRKMQDNPSFLKTFFGLVEGYVEKFDDVAKMRAASGSAFKGDAVSEADRARARTLAGILVAESEQVGKAETTSRRGKRPPVRRTADAYTIEEREFDRVVVGALMNFEREIDVTKFAAAYGWDRDRICDLYFDVLWNNPQVFFVTKRARCEWTHCGGIVTRFVISDIRYDFPPEEYPKRKAELDAAVAEALKTLPAGGDPVMKAKALHDHIVRVCEYDARAAEENDRSPLARTVYSVLVRRLAVCEGYTMAYRYLLGKAGIRSEEVISDAMAHCWNYVCLDGRWYHVDVTWDDPVYAGKNPADAPVLHDHFLLSDAAIRAKKHHGWDVRGLPEADDPRYDDRDWRE